MITFWIIAGLLVCAALLFVLPPLVGRRAPQAAATPAEVNLSVYRYQLRELDVELGAGTWDETQYRNAKNDLEGRVIEDAKLASEIAPASAAKPLRSQWPAIAAAVTVPLLAVSLYLVLGTPQGLDPNAASPQEGSAENGPAHATSPQQIQAMVARLEKKLEQQPNDADGWSVLARSYGALQRYEESSAAYARAIELQPNNAQLLADYADTLAMANDRSLQGEPQKIIQQALKADPHNLKALALAGTVDYERKNYQGALKYWQRILELVPPDSPIASSVASSVKEVQRLAGLPVQADQAASEPAGQGQTPEGAAQATVSGTVQLAPQLKGRVADSDTVFIFARAPGAKRGPPLAIMRKTVKDLPISFTLDDSMAMAPQFNLSSVPQVVVGARISKTGNAMPSPGDLEGYSAQAGVGAKDIKVTIDSTVN